MKVNEITLPFKPRKTIICEGMSNAEVIKLRNFLNNPDIIIKKELDLNSLLNIEILKIIKLLKELETKLNNKDCLFLRYLKDDYGRETLKERGLDLEYNYGDATNFSFECGNIDVYVDDELFKYKTEIEKIIDEIGMADNKDEYNECLDASIIKSCMFEWLIYRLYLGVKPSKHLIRLFLNLINKNRESNQKIPIDYINNVVNKYSEVIDFNNNTLFKFYSENW